MVKIKGSLFLSSYALWWCLFNQFFVYTIVCGVAFMIAQKLIKSNTCGDLRKKYVDCFIFHVF